MATRSSSLIVLPADGGLQALYDHAIIPPNAWAYIANGEYTPGGTVRIRYGITRNNTTALTLANASTGQAYAVSDFPRYAVSSSVLTLTQDYLGVFLSASSGGIFKNDLDGTWDTLLDPWTSATTAFPPSIILADGFAVFFNGRSTPQKWDQTSLTDLGASAPVGTGAAYHLRRLFVVGEASGDGSTVKYCAASDITDWTGGDTGPLPAFNENDGDYVIGASQPLDGKIYFFKGPNLGSIHELSGNTPATWTTRQIATGSPCISHRSIVTTNQDVYWASRRHIHSLRQLLTTGDSVISRPMERFLPFPAFAGTAFGTHDSYRNAIIWVRGTTDAVVYYYNLKKWTYWSFATSSNLYSVAHVWNASNTAYQLLFGGGNGVVFQMINDDGLAAFRDVNASGTAQDLTLTLRTPTHYSFPGIPASQEKILRSITLFGRCEGEGADGATASVTVTPLEENAEAAALTITLPRESDSTRGYPGAGYDIGVSEARSRWFAFEASLTNTADRPEIAGYAITVDPGEDISYEAA